MQTRKRIERAIYQNLSGSKNYSVISYSKETKKTKILTTCDNLQDARVFRDTHLRSAKYGKGIQKSNNKYKAEISLYAGNKVSTFYIGVFDTPELARAARLKFIESLK